MDLATLRDRAEARFRDPSNRIVSTAEWASYLNEAYRDVVIANPYWPFLEQKNEAFIYTAEAAQVNLPADVWKVRSVFNVTDELPLVQLDGSTSHIDAYPFADEFFDTPTHYRIYGRTIEIYPRPAVNTTLRIDFAGTVAELSLTTDEPVFAEHWHHILIEGALARAYEDDGNYTAADRQWDKFGAMIESMKDDLLSTRGERYPTIADTWESGW